MKKAGSYPGGMAATFPLWSSWESWRLVLDAQCVLFDRTLTARAGPLAMDLTLDLPQCSPGVREMLHWCTECCCTGLSTAPASVPQLQFCSRCPWEDISPHSCLAPAGHSHLWHECFLGMVDIPPKKIERRWGKKKALKARKSSVTPAGHRHRYSSWNSLLLKCQWNVCLAEALGRGIATVRLEQTNK